MGVSIHYSGAMDVAQVEALCEELADIAKSLGFKNSVEVDDDDKGLRGIILCPASKMEPIPFLFDSTGRLHALGDLIAGWAEKTAILSVAVKTQFAGEKDHILLIGLLRYIQRKYIPSLEVTDEGGYWESNDREELRRRIEALEKIIKGLGAAVENAFMDRVIDKDNPDELADFIEQVAKGFNDDIT